MFRLLTIMILMPWLFVTVQRNQYNDIARERQRLEQERQAQFEEEAKNELIVNFNNQLKPEIDWVSLNDPYERGRLNGAAITDIYNWDVMSSGVVGLVGAPMRITFDDGLDSVELTFHYVPDKLRGMPERNFLLLHQEEDGFYVEAKDVFIDEENNTVSTVISEDGVYLLADRYQWYTVWGYDVSDYAYTIDPLQYESDWERECDTGSIMEIADREWALQNGPVFHVSTPEQLAGVVYYVNAINDLNMESIEIYLEDDIDLAGYDWVPMGWLGAMNIRYDGLVDGQGHKISNMDIHIPYNNHCAFIAYSTGVTVQNITFENASVSGGAYTGIVGGEIYISRKWSNVHVTGTISQAYGEVGSIIGRESVTTFENCTAQVVFLEQDGEQHEIEYFSQRQEILANTPATEDFTLTLGEDGSVNRTESEESFRNLCWHVEVDGVEVLSRLAEKETSFNPMEIIPQYIPQGSVCRIWLDAFTGETYTRVSNIVEYPTN